VSTSIPAVDASPAVVVGAVDAGSAPARDCLAAYAAELAARLPGYTRSALAPPDRFAVGRGAFLMARSAGRPVGCGAWSRLGPDEAEIRHLWVSTDVRGQGVGRRLLAALEDDAARHGVRTLRLGTHPALAEAVALYRSSGYRQTPPHDDEPHHLLGFAKSVPPGEPWGEPPGEPLSPAAR